jgi:aquaporin Z
MNSSETAIPAVREAVRGHWLEYLIEGGALAGFMIVACLLVALLEYPSSPVRHVIDASWVRRLLTGLAMGATLIAIVYSPWGKQSGAHLNPAVTLTFFRLRRVETRDAVGYVIAQFAGAALGVMAAVWLIGKSVVGDPSVHFVVTRPGMHGAVAAFVAETLISFAMMLAVLAISNQRPLNRYTGLIAGALLAMFIAIESPFSGTSMNPARSFGSALSARDWQWLWIYFTAPVIGMFVAAELYVRTHGHSAVLCCKLHHENDRRCIFRCRYHEAVGEQERNRS